MFYAVIYAVIFSLVLQHAPGKSAGRAVQVTRDVVANPACLGGERL
jgi:hypothetical protein